MLNVACQMINCDTCAAKKRPPQASPQSEAMMVGRMNPRPKAKIR